MYLSGRPLHAVTTNLAARIAEEFEGELPLSFAGGADCFNVADLLGAGMRTITVCSDLLKSGGYLRMLQYTGERGRRVRRGRRARHRRLHPPDGAGGRLRGRRDGRSRRRRLGRRLRAVQPPSVRRRGPARLALREVVVPDGPVQDPPRPGRLRLHRGALPRRVPGRPAGAPLHGAPCAPGTSRGRPHHPARQPAARRSWAGSATTCARTPASARTSTSRWRSGRSSGSSWSRRSSAGAASRRAPRPAPGWRSSGPDRPAWRRPSGWPTPASASRSSRSTRTPAAWSAARSRPTACRRRRSTRTWPSSRASASRSATARRAGVDFTLEALRAEGFAAIFVAVGAQRAKTLGLPGEDARGVIDGVTFLRGVKEGRPAAIGPRVGVVGAGDTAMDCVRSARRVGASSVSLIYRRTVDQMPADPEEIHAIREEGIEIVELARPVGLHVEDGGLAGAGLHADRVPRRTRRRGPQGSVGRAGLRVRDRPGHPDPRDQPAPGARLLRRPAARADARAASSPWTRSRSRRRSRASTPAATSRIAARPRS